MATSTRSTLSVWRVLLGLISGWYFLEVKTLRNGFRFIYSWNLVENLSSRFMIIDSCLPFSNELRHLLEMIHLQKVI